MDSIKDIIRDRALGELRTFASGVENNSRVFQSLKRVETQISHDYASRVLLELLQNAYDAQRHVRDGREILIRLGLADGVFGVLYVANRGTPFLRENFDAICQIGLSSKPPGEEIGNKGLGFRSVLGVCDYPEVYSQMAGTDHQEAGTFTGFCFGFARDSDVRSLMCSIGHEPLAEKALEEVSRYALPVPLEEQSPAIRELARAGYATVVVLPLRDLQSQEILRQQLREQIAGDSVPLLLFLSGIRNLRIEIADAESVETQALERCSTVLPAPAGAGDTMEIAAFGDLGRYLVASCKVDKGSLAQSIDESIVAHRLPVEWHKWQGDAVVSVAVRLDGPGDTEPRLCNFLPMGKSASAPFAGHLNAPFYAHANRQDLETDVPLNHLFLREGARLCQRTVVHLAADGGGLEPFTENAGAIIDLVSWSGEHMTLLETAFHETGTPLTEAAVVPAQTAHGTGFTTLPVVRQWQDEGRETITRDRILQYASTALVLGDLQAARVTRLDHLKELLCGSGLDPDPMLAAEWAAKIAKAHGERPFDAPFWNGFYSDLADMFADAAEARSALAGKEILLCEDGRLRACPGPDGERSPGRRQATVFLRRLERSLAEPDEDGDVSVPSRLRPYFCFMHPDLRWYEGQRQAKPSRVFLEAARLVRRYETSDLLRNLADVLRTAHTSSVMEDALWWVYGIFRSTDYKQSPGFNQLGLAVPTRSGWIKAQEAFIGGGWGSDCGDRLRRLVDEAKSLSADLERISGLLLLPPSDWPQPIDREEMGPWLEFLRRAGVQEGLLPLPIGQEAGVEQEGRHFTGALLAERLGLAGDDAAHFVEECGRRGLRVWNPYTAHGFSESFLRLPAQFEFGAFPPSAKRLWAQLLIESMERWPGSAFSNLLQGRNCAYRKQYAWPTPALVFLRYHSWLPVRDTGGTDSVDFARPDQAWLFDDPDGSAPPFVPFVTGALTRPITALGLQGKLRQRLGLNIWNAPECLAAQLAMLGRVFSAGNVAEAFLDRLRHHYAETWRCLLDAAVSQGNSLPGDMQVVLGRHGQLTACSLVELRQAGERVVIPHDEDRVSGRMFEELGVPILEIARNPTNKDIAALTTLLAIPVAAATSSRIEIRADGRVVGVQLEGELLRERTGEWLKQLLCVVVATQRGFQNLRAPAVRDRLAARFDSVRLLCAKALSIVVDGVEQELPPQLGDAVPVESDSFALVVLRDSGEMTYHGLLQKLVEPLCQLLSIPRLSREAGYHVLRLCQDGLLCPESVLSAEDLSRLVGVPLPQVTEVLAGLQHAEDRLRQKLKPLFWYLGAEEEWHRLGTLNEGSPWEQAPSVLQGLLEPAGVHLPASSSLEALVSQAEDCYQLRDTLGLDFARYNQVLTELGPPYRPERNAEGQSQCFAAFLHRQQEAILQPIRLAFLETACACGDLQEYVRLRSFPDLVPDPAWLDTCKLPDDAMMWSRVHRWHASQGLACRQDTCGPALPPRPEILERNRAACRAFQVRYATIVRCFCLRLGTACPLWASEGSQPNALLNDLETLGALDFAELGETQIAGWLGSRGLWPAGKEASSALESWGLKQSDLDAEQDEAGRQRQAAEAERNSICLDGAPVPAREENYLDLAGKVRDGISDGFRQTQKRTASLTELSPPQAGRPGAGGRKATRLTGKRRDMNQTRLKAIGLVGEVAAFEWLKAQYPDEFSEDCWVSGYRNLVLGGAQGEDSLGYDFEIKLKSRTLYFEVKATVEDETELELGETEIVKAQECAFDREKRYRILFITRVTDSVSRNLRVLPNPFSKLGKNRFRAVGTGIRYRFEPESVAATGASPGGDDI